MSSMPRSRRLLRAVSALGSLPLLAALAACSGAGAGTGAGGPGSGSLGYVSGDGTIRTVAAGDRKPAPDVSGELLDGSRFRLASLRGKVVVLNFWASWCPPCRAETPGLERVYEETRAKGVAFVGVDHNDTSRTNARIFVREHDVGYPSFYDQPGDISLLFRGTLPPEAIPSTLVLDRQGRIAARVIGQVSPATLEPIVLDLAREPAT